MNRRYDAPYFPKSTPRQVEGGLRAKSARGAIATTWWSKRFIDVLQSMGMDSRLARGRNYARRGQVLSLELDAGQVTASVQGSRARPYRVRVGIAAYGKAEWARVEERLGGDAWFVAQLLSGQMPPDIEQVFADLDLPLFPAAAADLSLDCSCPDWGVPCKHLAAVLYLLAERFDEDPFQILAWRGRDREDLLAHLDAGQAEGADAGDAVVALTDLLDVFWDGSHGSSSSGDPVEGALSDSRLRTTGGPGILDQLPEVAVTVRGRPLAEVLRPVYEAVGETEE
ncbi:SWIM zinc finger family protein [Microbacterium sp.]|uniref:SWIM zinc finger family protein n=1 Tax=Microbacterium sp. TaxID=51671 RepID=UPI003A89D925